MTAANTFEADKIDNSFPYVLVSSLLVALISLAAVWVSTATTFGPMVGAKAIAILSNYANFKETTMTRVHTIMASALATAVINVLVAVVDRCADPRGHADRTA